MANRLLPFPATRTPGLPLVLLIEPHLDTREMMRAWLGAHGFRCGEPAAGETRLDAFSRLEPDAVLVTAAVADDSWMPLISTLRGAAGPKPLPIALIATAVDQELLCRARQAGATVCLEKPVAFTPLLNLLRTSLGGAQPFCPADQRAG